MADIINESGGSSRILSSCYTVQSKPINGLAQDRVLPRQVSTGMMRGIQGVGGQGVIVDSANNRIGVGKIANTDSDYAVELTANGIEVNDGSTRFIRVTQDGFSITDGTTTFISITINGIMLNDGTTDRVLIGKDEGGF